MNSFGVFMVTVTCLIWIYLATYRSHLGMLHLWACVKHLLLSYLIIFSPKYTILYVYPIARAHITLTSYERDGVSNHWRHYCLHNRLFRRRSKKTSKLRVTGLCEGNSPVTGEFPSQRTSNAENVSIWWRHHGHHGGIAWISRADWCLPLLLSLCCQNSALAEESFLFDFSSCHLFMVCCLCVSACVKYMI